MAKIWKFKERYSAQFRAEFFNLFNRADFPIPGVVNPAAVQVQTGWAVRLFLTTPTPDTNNPVLGSGGPRHIQFGLEVDILKAEL